MARTDRLEPRELDALARLLSDRDEQMVAILAGKVAALHDRDLERLLGICDLASENCPQALTEGVRRRMVERFVLYVEAAAARPDLEAGLVLISSWARPDLSRVPVSRMLDDLASEVRDRRGWASIGLQDVLELLFQERGFRGNKADYEDPNNSLIAAVLQRRIGIPISLCCLTLLVCRRLRIAVRPVGAPGRFLLAVKQPSRELFIDCFDGGRVLDRAGALALLPPGASGAGPFPVTTTRDILARTLRNLANAYAAREETGRLQDIWRLLTSLRTTAPSAQPD